MHVWQQRDCCRYGDRIPGVWFHPGSRRLYVIDGHAGPGTNGGRGADDQCPMSKQLAAGQTSKLRIDMTDHGIDVLLNDKLGCTERHTTARLPFTDVIVYASDPWYPAADATLSHFQLHVGETPALHRNEGFTFNPGSGAEDGRGDGGH